MKTYNLKKAFNWRGDVAELLAKYVYGGRRTKGYDFRRDAVLSTKENAFLKRFWNRIDLYRYDDSGQLAIYEVKAKTFGVTRRPDITTSSLRVYEQALAQKIKVYLVTVNFHDDWEVSFSLEEFDKKRFRVNDGGWYRRSQIMALQPATPATTKRRG